MPRPADVEISTRDLQRLSRDIRAIPRGEGRELRQQYVRDVKEIVNRNMIPALRSKIESLPSQGQSAAQGKASLRRATAKAVVFSFKIGGNYAGAMVRINPKKMLPARRFSGFLPSYMEGTPGFTVWRHKTFGHDPEHDQERTPYFAETVARYTPEVITVIQEGSQRIIARAIRA